MIDTINHITDLIAVNFLVSFAFYSIIYFSINFFLKDKTSIQKFDKSAINLMIWVGTLWVVLKLVGIFIFFYQMQKEVDRSIFNQNLNRFTQGSWFQLILWLLLAQLLRVPFLRKSLIYRIIMSLLFVFSIERIDIILIAFDRGNISSFWPLDIGIVEIIIGLITKTLIFITTVSIYYFGIKKIKSNKVENKTI